MKSSFGKNLRVTIFGGSHEDHIGVCIEGFPSDFAIDFQALQAFMQRRAPGQNPYSTPRKERDIPRLQSRDPLTFIIQNEDRKSGHYSNLRQVPRPGHADYTARVKYGDQINMAGGGPFSARMTAPLCVAGGIALQYLAAQGIQIHGEVTEIHGVRGEKMLEEILAAKAKGDSVGGIVSAQVTGLPPGIGGPMYDGLE
ncbi:MAG: chorismate synthase, partial [Anaerovoracaceae bacterium]